MTNERSRTKPTKGAPVRGPKGKRTYGELLQHAAKLFAKYGYDGVGLQEIADIAGVTKGSLYYHFEGKRHIYTESVELVVSAAFESSKPPVLHGTTDMQLDQYLKWILSVMQSSSLARRLLLHMVIDHDIELMDRLMKSTMGPSLDMFMGILRKMKLKKDKTVLAYFFYSICMVNHELAGFSDVFLPKLGNKVDDTKAAGYLKAMIESW